MLLVEIIKGTVLFVNIIQLLKNHNYQQLMRDCCALFFAGNYQGTIIKFKNAVKYKVYFMFMTKETEFKIFKENIDIALLTKHICYCLMKKFKRQFVMIELMFLME